MTTDRELLELAARAAGLCIDEHARNGSAWAWVYPIGSVPDGDGDLPIFKWSPLKDDGDCARLEAALGIDICWWDQRVEAFACHKQTSWDVSEHYSDHNNNRQAARRMAVLKVAAEIQRAKGVA